MKLLILGAGHSWEESLEKFEFLDGTPFGKLVEEGGEKC